MNANLLGIGLVAIVGLTVGCEQAAPTRPTPAQQPETLRVTAITPTSGPGTAPLAVTIRGTGFVNGATVTVGSAATAVVVLDGTTISAVTQAHGPGPVDVVVTNPTGASATLDAGFTYLVDLPYTISSSLSTVAVGGQVSVSWDAPRAGPADWIGFFLVTDSNYVYEDRWWQYTEGAKSGSTALIAPATPGKYEFRYLVDDGYEDVARSAPVTVTPQ